MPSPSWIVLGALLLGGAGQEDTLPVEADAFQFPCEGYLVGMRGKGNFGVYIDPRWNKSPFAGSHHLADGRTGQPVVGQVDAVGQDSPAAAHASILLRFPPCG